MIVIIYRFNLNISPKMSYGVLECDIVVIELHAYDFVIQDFVIKKGCYLCRTTHTHTHMHIYIHIHTYINMYVYTHIKK